MFELKRYIFFICFITAVFTVNFLSAENNFAGIEQFKSYTGNSTSYYVYKPGAKVKFHGAIFECMRTVGNDFPPPSSPIEVEKNTFWKLVWPELNDNKNKFPIWNGVNYTSYNIGDTVSYNNKLYTCIKKADNSIPPSRAPNLWQLTNHPPTFLIAKAGIQSFPIWDAFNFTEFNAGDSVLYKGHIYECKRKINNTQSPDVLKDYWSQLKNDKNNSNINVIIISANTTNTRFAVSAKLFQTALALGYNTIFLVDNTSQTNDFAKEAITQYSKAISNFSELVNKKIFVSTKENIISKLNSFEPDLIYYVGDGDDNLTNGTCSGIVTNTSTLTYADISEIKFKEDTVFVANACHGIDAPFGTAIFNAGITSYAAGTTSLYEPFDLILGLNVFTSILKGANIETSFKNASELTPSLFTKYNYKYACGVWGYYVNQTTFYQFQGKNSYCPNPNYNNNFFSNFKSINFVPEVEETITDKEWPFKSNNLGILCYPGINPAHCENTKIIN